MSPQSILNTKIANLTKKVLEFNTCNLILRIMPLLLTMTAVTFSQMDLQAQTPNPECRVHLYTAGKYNPNKKIVTSGVERNAKRCRQSCLNALRKTCAAVWPGDSSNLLVTNIRFVFDENHPACLGVDMSDFRNPLAGAAKSPDGYYYGFCL